MAIDVKFTKFDNTPWGFRLTGGSEYGFPMTVVRVYEGSLAESFGLREGDILVAINEQGLVGVSHESVHEYITRAGNNFIATILRGSFDMDELQNFTARIEKQPLFPSCVSQESNNNYNISLITTPTPLSNGTCVNKVPSDQETSSSPCPNATQTNIPSPTSIFKPVAKTYKPFTKDINTTLPPLEKPSIVKSPLHKEDFQTIKQSEFLEAAKKLVPDICKYVDKKNIGRSTPTFVIENLINSTESTIIVDGVERSKFEVNKKEFKSVKAPGQNENDADIIRCEMKEDNVVKCNIINGIHETEQPEKIKETNNKDISTIRNGQVKEIVESINTNDSLTNGKTEVDIKLKEKTSAVTTEEIVCNEKVKKEKKITVKDDVIINGVVLLDLNEIEKSAKIDDMKSKNEKIIEVVKEFENKVEQNVKQDVRKSVKCMVEDYTRATTPSPSLYKMSCRIRNPSVTPVPHDPVNVIEEVKIIKEEIIHYSPVPRPIEPKPKVAEKQKESPKVVTDKYKKKATRRNPAMLTKEVHELSTSDMSLEEAKINAISAASVLSHEAKQRNYKIPCVSANIPSQNQSDVLLKTFFIHLTDVMVALTKMITNNECCHCGRVISECTHKTNEVREQSQTVSNLVKEISEKVSNTQMFKESNKTSEKVVQQTVLETSPEKRAIQKNEAVQTEAFKEVFQNTSKLGVDVTVNGKDPLVWLADLDENKIIKTDESKTLSVVKENNEENFQASQLASEISRSEVVQTSESIQQIQSVTSKAEERIAFRTVEEKQTVQRRENISVPGEKKEETNVHVEETGDNEFSVCLSKPKSLEEDKIVVSEIKIENKDDTTIMDSIDTERTLEVEMTRMEETNLSMNQTYSMISDSENIEIEEEITTQPVKKVKKPKKKKMMKVVAKDPQTPNTDEFFFRLDVKLDGLRSKTPEVPKDREDLSIVRKPNQGDTHDPQSISEKKGSLKLDLRNKPDEVFVLVCQPSSEDSTPSEDIITKKSAVSIAKETMGTISSESLNVQKAKVESESLKIVEASNENTNAAASITNICNVKTVEPDASNISAISDNVLSTNNSELPEKSDMSFKTTCDFVVENLINVEQQTSQASAHASSFIQTKDESSKLATDSNTATLQSKESQIIQNGCTKTSKAETKVTSALNNVKMPTSEVCERVEQTKQETRKSSQEKIEYMETKESFKSKETHESIGRSTSETITNIKGELKIQNGLDRKEVYNGYTNGQIQDDRSVVDSNEESVAVVKTKEANIGYATVDAGRLTNGCNDQNGDSTDELGKAGLTDDEIAAILTGEAEVLKDQHVIGLQKVLASHMSRPDENDDSRINFNKMMPVIGFLKDSEVFKALNEETIKSRADLLEEQRKHTKFLQKPNRPIPFCKRIAEQQSKEPAYRVDIRPQKKRDSIENGSSILTEGVFLIPEVPILVPEPPPELYVAPEYLEDSAFPDLEDTGIPIPERKPETPKPEETVDEVAFEGETNNCEEDLCEEVEEQVAEEDEMKEPQGVEWNKLVVDETIDESLPVEEQLLKVQKQLEALSKLPAAIQQTLDIVTKQLVKMVPRGDTPAPTTMTNSVQEIETSSVQIEEVEECSLKESKEVTTITECVEQNGVQESRTSSRNEDGRKSVQFEERVKVREIRNGSECGMSEENDIQQMKQDVIDQLQLEHMSRQVKQRPTSQTGGPSSYKATKQPMFGPLTPEARPIVLPGGRKWRGPKDAFTDTFIAETLSGQATVIQGKAIGNHAISSDSQSSESVDFMKYNKPPISLDHLKDSPVYKLVHEIEDEPMHGVANRGIVIAESEYRERCRSVTPNHMENGGAF